MLATWKLRECTFSNSLKTKLVKLICADFGKSDFLNVHIFNWYKALYSACSSIFPHLDFVRGIVIISCSFHHSTFVR